MFTKPTKLLFVPIVSNIKKTTHRTRYTVKNVIRYQQKQNDFFFKIECSTVFIVFWRYGIVLKSAKWNTSKNFITLNVVFSKVLFSLKQTHKQTNNNRISQNKDFKYNVVCLFVLELHTTMDVSEAHLLSKLRHMINLLCKKKAGGTLPRYWLIISSLRIVSFSFTITTSKLTDQLIFMYRFTTNKWQCETEWTFVSNIFRYSTACFTSRQNSEKSSRFQDVFHSLWVRLPTEKYINSLKKWIEMNQL